MARNLYSAYRSAGTSSGQYKASLYETSDWADKFDFIDKQTAWEEEKTSRTVGAISSAFELASTVSEEIETQSEFKSDILPELQEKKFEVDFSPEDYGLEKGTTFGQFKELQPDVFAGAMGAYKPKQVDQSIWEKLAGKEKMYTFGEGGKEYKQSDLTALGQESFFSSIQKDFGLDESMGEELGISSIKPIKRPKITEPDYNDIDIAGDLKLDDMTDLLSLQDSKPFRPGAGKEYLQVTPGQNNLLFEESY